MPDIFAVIADGTRRDILQALLDRFTSAPTAKGPLSVGLASPGEMSVGELVVKLGLSQPTVSKHLRVLRDSNLVRVRERGQHRYYSLDPAPLASAEGWLVKFLSTTEVVVPAPSRSLPAPGRSLAAGRAVGRAVADVSSRAAVAIGSAAAGLRDIGRGIRGSR